LAKEVGLDASKIKDDIESGKAYKEFMKDIKECRKRGISGFPTFLIKRLKDGFETIKIGYRKYPEFKKILEEISYRELKERKIEFEEKEAIDFMRHFGKVATQEIAVLFDISKKDAYSFLKNLENKKLINSQKAGNDYFWYL
jgi:predicted HTH transcriptional regulator